jgi:hypothetical protein
VIRTTKKPVKVTKKPGVPPPTPWPTNIGRFVPIGNLIVLGGDSYLTTQAAISANGSVVAASFPGNISVYRLNHNASHWDPIGMFYYGLRKSDGLAGPFALSSDGSVIALSVNRGSSSGYVVVYRYQSNQWIPLGISKSNNNTATSVIPVQASSYGTSLALSADGTILAIRLAATSRVNVYHWNGTHWQQRGSSIPAAGSSVAISSNGNIVATTLQVYRYDANGGLWVPMGKSISADADTTFSGPIALSANGLRVAASQFPSSNHANTYVAVRVFQYHPAQNEWQAVGSGAFAEFVPPYLGNSVSISGDGSLVAVGSGLGQLMSDGNDYVYEHDMDPNWF